MVSGLEPDGLPGERTSCVWKGTHAKRRKEGKSALPVDVTVQQKSITDVLLLAKKASPCFSRASRSIPCFKLCMLRNEYYVCRETLRVTSYRGGQRSKRRWHAFPQYTPILSRNTPKLGRTTQQPRSAALGVGSLPLFLLPVLSHVQCSERHLPLPAQVFPDCRCRSWRPAPSVAAM